MTEDVCQCPKCGRMHRRLTKSAWRNRSRTLITRIRNTVKRARDGGDALVDLDELSKLLDERIAD